MGTKNQRQIDLDRALITRLGGPSKLAQTLGFKRFGGAQRVQNWKVRGIPAAVKVAFPKLLMPKKP